MYWDVMISTFSSYFMRRRRSGFGWGLVLGVGYLALERLHGEVLWLEVVEEERVGEHVGLVLLDGDVLD